MAVPDGAVGRGNGRAVRPRSAGRAFPVVRGTLGAGDYYWGRAASTIFWVDPKEDLVAIFMTQLMPSSTYPVRREIKTMIYSALAA